MPLRLSEGPACQVRRTTFDHPFHFRGHDKHAPPSGHDEHVPPNGYDKRAPPNPPSDTNENHGRGGARARGLLGKG